jgi:hypothetical protein
MGKRIFTTIALVLFIGVLNIQAQDPGIPDTVRIDSVQVNQGNKAVLNINFYNDEELAAVEVPIIYSSDDISIDSISFVGSRISYLANKIVTIDNANRQAVIAAIVMVEAYIPSGSGLFCKVHFNIPAGIPDQKIFVDTAFFSPSSNLLFVLPSSDGFIPEFKKGVIVVGNPTLPPVIEVNPDSLYFEAVAGGVFPSTQILNITNIGEGILRWTATKQSTWLNVSPSFGVGTSNVQIFANTTGLPVGYYYDTIVVSDTNATNDPIKVPVKLRLIEPPPTIHLSQTNFNFNAIADSANPPNQTLIITNTGQGELQWIADNSSSWLTINPISGIDSGNITLSVNIVGLGYGIYYDTIIVSDPDATNDPQIAVVKLQVASGLPVIAVDSPLVFVVVDMNNPYPPDRAFYIFNEGGGAMDYRVTDSSPRITGLTPDSGAVPQSVTASFKTLSGNAGDNIFDTVWIYSDEAINSPHFMIFQFHYVDEPAEIALNKDSITASRYECAQGTGAQPSLSQFSIFNYGTDPMTFNLSWSSSWLIPNKTTGPTPSIVTLDFDYRGLAPGTYRDTIVVTAINAINSPVRLPVKLTILPTSTPPLISAYTDTIYFTAQENRPGKEFYVEVNNANPGCMSWGVDEDISWLSYDVDSSNNYVYPWRVKFMPFAGGITWGAYNAQCSITSPTASNSPFPLKFKLEVWKFYGDCDYNGILNIRDITYLIRYLYQSGPAPKPERQVGDCDCNFRVNVADITELISYLYIDHNPICGNPY